MTDVQASTPAALPARILCVDDEPSILSALRRVFRPAGYAVLTAGSGQQALDLLACEPVDLVISDMRMPQMDGAQFLEQVFARWPDTMRILLTGYADVATTIAAVNQGKIWSYIAKPWNDAELVKSVEQALAHGQLSRENAALVALTQRQNEALRQLNASLEEKVAARTAELQQTVAFLDQAHADLKQGFLSMVRMLIGLLETRSPRLAGHGRRVADSAHRIAGSLGLTEAEIQQITLAALLHDIGKCGQPEHLLEKPTHTMTASERAEYMHHVQRGEMLLKTIEPLQDAAKVVRHHHECFDGSGFPDHLVGLAIPSGARIVAVANDYDALQIGTLTTRQLSPAQATAYIRENRGKRYDPRVVDIFLAQVADQLPEEIRELSLRPGSLRPGMTLTRDLLHPEGYLLLAKGQAVDTVVIEQLLKIEAQEGQRLTLYIKPAD